MEQNLGNKPMYVDTTKDLMSMFVKFDSISINMVKCKSLREFDHWFHKCFSLDRRCTLLFLRKYIDRIPDDYIFYAELYLNEKINKNNGNENVHIKNDGKGKDGIVEVYDIRDKDKYDKRSIKLKWKK